MNRSTPLRPCGKSSAVRLLTALAVTASLLAACSPLSLGADTPSTSSPSATASPDVQADSLRAYYEALIADLKQELLDAKQADYIAAQEYEARIRELEAKLTALENTPAGSDIPVSGDPDPEPPAETQAVTTPAPNAPSASFRYEITNGGAVILAYLGTATHVTIPESISGYPVTRIADDAFKASDVTSVILPDTVTHIGWLAFADCSSLTSVTLPASVTSIDYGAFDGCPNLTVYCPKDSYAARFALSFGLRVRYL